MSLINYASREINCKLVYYGPGLGGKTTNLEYIYEKVAPASRGKMISLATETERTLFFDFLPVDLGTIRGFKTRFHLYTVPGTYTVTMSNASLMSGRVLGITCTGAATAPTEDEANRTVSITIATASSPTIDSAVTPHRSVVPAHAPLHVRAYAQDGGDQVPVAVECLMIRIELLHTLAVGDELAEFVLSDFLHAASHLVA